MSTKELEISRQQVIDSWLHTRLNFSELQTLVEDYEEVFSADVIPPINSNPKLSALLGDQVLEPNTKYKN